MRNQPLPKKKFGQLRKFFSFFIPPAKWQIPVIVLLGMLTGLGIYIFIISNAAAYLSDKPETCINCHVMIPQYAGWKRSSHSRAATCMDCHVPHDNVFRKYAFKIKDGTRHAAIFTMHAEPQVIHIKEDGAAVVQENCLRCHEHVLQDLSIHQATYEDYKQGKSKLCWECHREVPHGRGRSLASAPFALAPELPKVVPEWMEKLIPILEKYQHK